MYWNILTMHGPINFKSPNNTSKWQVEFNSTFKGSIMCWLSSCYRIWSRFDCSCSIWKMLLINLWTPTVCMWNCIIRGRGRFWSTAGRSFEKRLHSNIHLSPNILPYSYVSHVQRCCTHILFWDISIISWLLIRFSWQKFSSLFIILST
jgi:hypothetical protein